VLGLLLLAPQVSQGTAAGHSPSPVDVASAGDSSGCTLFVAATGSDSGSGSEAQPWKTLQKAADVVAPGDVVCVKAGTYAGFHIKDKHGGGESSRIVFRPFRQERVVIDSHVNDDANTWHGVEISGSSYISIVGFEITDSNPLYDSQSFPDYSQGYGRDGVKINPPFQRGSFGASTYIRVDDNHIFHIGSMGILDDDGSFNEFINNEISQVGLSKQGYGMYIGGDDVVVRGNRVSYAYGYGLSLYSGHNAPDRAIVENNAFFHNGQSDYGRGYPCGPGLGDCSKWDPAVGVRRGDGIIAWGGNGNTMRNNISYGNSEWGIRVHTNAAVFNNTTYGNYHQGIYVYDSNSAIIRNNIAYHNQGQDGYPGDAYIGPGNIQDHNLFGADPKFANPLAGDFHLTASSPAIDAGSSQDAPSSDFEGNPRPQGAGYDLGAYEFLPGDPITFTDVPRDHWAHADIEKLYQEGYVVGCQTTPQRKYCPEQGLTRAEAAVFVVRGVRGAGFAPPQPTQSAFADVPLSHWGVEWIEQLWSDGFTAGCATAPLRFCAEAPHTRAEATVFFVRMLRGKDYLPSEPASMPYSDVALDAWYFKWVAAAYDAGLTQDCEDPPNRSDDRFRPEQAITRAEAACMMVKAKGLSATP